MIDFTDREKKILSSIGNSQRGDQFIGLLKRIVNDLSNVDTIENTVNAGAEVEGRKLFKKAIQPLIDALSYTDRPIRPIEQDEFE